MAAADVKRTASIYINDADAQRALKRLQEEAKHLVKRLEEVPVGSKDFKDISNRLVGVQRNMKALSQESKEQDGWFTKMKGSLGGLGAMLAGVFAFDTIKSGVQATLNAHREHEKAVAKVETSLQNAGRTAGVTFQQIAADANRLQEESFFSDEDIMTKASTSLLNFGNIAGDNFMRAQQMAVDLSTTMEGDLQGAAMAVGKALNNPVQGLTALQRMGVRFTEDQKAVIKTLVDTGRAGEAQGIILAELEKRFAGQAKAQAEAEGGYHRLSVALDELAEGIGGKLSGAFSALAGWLGDAVNTGAEWLGLTEKQSDQVARQRIEMNSLFGVLRAGNITEEQRAELVARVNKEYGEFLPRAISVTDTEQELAIAQAATNAAMRERILLLAKQEVLSDAQAAAVEEQKEALEAELKVQEVRQTGGTVLENLMAKSLGYANALQYYTSVLQAQKGHAEEADAALADLAKRMGDVNAAVAGAGGTTSEVGMDVAVEDPEVVNAKAEKVREVLADARARMAGDNLKGKEKELAELADKYWKIAQQAEGSGVGLEEIENQHAEERAQVRAKWAKKELDEMRELDAQIAKLRMEAAARDSGETGRAVAQVQEKYAALMEAARGNAEQEAELQRSLDAELATVRAEGIAAQREEELQLELSRVEDKYSKLEESAKGHTSRLVVLEELKQEELTAVRERHTQLDQERREELLSIEEEERIADIERTLTAMDETYALEVEKRKEQELGFEDLRIEHEERRAELEAELLEAKKEVVNQHFEELYAQFDEQNISTENLQRLHGQAIAAIDADAARTQVGLTREKNAAIVASEQARNQAVKATAVDMLDALDAVFTASAGDAKEAQDFHKAITLVKIGVDTASAISGIVAGAAIGDPFTAAIRIAAGVAVVLTNIAKATALMNREAPEPPKFAVGGSTGTALPSISQGGRIGKPTLGLFGEEGAEWVAPNRMYTHPVLAPVFHWLEDIRVSGNIRQYAMGGSTIPSKKQRYPGAADVGDAGGAEDNGMADLLRSVGSAVAQLSGVLASGIEARVNYDQQKQDASRMSDITSAANRSR